MIGGGRASFSFTKARLIELLNARQIQEFLSTSVGSVEDDFPKRMLLVSSQRKRKASVYI
jgi:hypothetical protein